MNAPLSRLELDLVNTIGDSLAVEDLLPGRSVAEGDRWDHETEALCGLLSMDQVAVCEVSSVVVGTRGGQVAVRLAGTVLGTIDGASTEMELRGAYLFDPVAKRISRLNLAVQEERTPSGAAPGLSVTAKLKLQIKPLENPPTFSDEALAAAHHIEQPVADTLSYHSPLGRFRLEHPASWYVTSEAGELVSLRCLQDGELVAHCNMTTLPPRSAGRHTTLRQFEEDVRASLGEHLEEIVTASEWDTPQENHCLGIVAIGTVEEVPVEWRYYLVAADGLPRVSLAVTLERSVAESFGDTDRGLIDSLQLLPLTEANAGGEAAK